MKLTHVSKERCLVYNMNLRGIHWQGKEGGVLWKMENKANRL